MIDLRSDTITQPTDAMKRAMCEAPLGDDVLGDDPTVKRLEARCAEMSGKEAAVFVPSGTMANLVAIRVSTRPGDEVLMHEDAHPFHYESAGAAHVAGVQLRLLPGPNGLITAGSVRGALKPPADWVAPTTLLCLEDTSNRGGGAVLPLDAVDGLCGEARAGGLSTHLDGARVLHAVIASGVPLATRARSFDTVCFCFSKGLGAPAGSILCGDVDRISLARRIRKMLGGGMRQSGMLAGAALYALDHHVERLADDHDRAAALSRGLRAAGFHAHVPETNILLVDVDDAPALAARLEGLGLRCLAIAPRRLRLVVHLGIDDRDVAGALDAFRAAVG